MLIAKLAITSAVNEENEIIQKLFAIDSMVSFFGEVLGSKKQKAP